MNAKKEKPRAWRATGHKFNSWKEDNRNCEIVEIKSRLTIPQVWTALNLSGQPSKSCCSPFRQEKNPSFSVYDNGRKWKDFGSGDGGDVIAFVQHARNCSFKEALSYCAQLIGMAGRWRV